MSNTSQNEFTSTADDSGLGKWAVIDIETTGADAGVDEIIDVGYLQFDGVKLIRKFQSLARPSFEVSHFIQKLTGITNKMLKDAPLFDMVVGDILELDDHHLLAHNSDFEASFLDSHFQTLDSPEGHHWEDSLYFLSILFPHLSSLKLEHFILGMGLADKEMHRGYEDSLDLLKVIIVATLLVREDKEKQAFVTTLYNKYQLQDYWYFKFFNLYTDELQEICDAIDFEPEAHIAKAREWLYPKFSNNEASYDKNFDLDFNGQNVKNIFRDEPKVQELFPGYSYRESQESLALRVGQSFKNHVHAMVQAPTGTGKTLGYLIPSALFSLTEGKQVLVATGTKTLQAQAMQKDVPGLHKLLGVDPKDLRVKQLIGSSNHLCELLFTQMQAEDALFSMSGALKDKFSDMYFESVFFHNGRSPLEEMISRGDLPFLFKMKIENFKDRDKELAVDFRACSGSQCPFKNECTYIRGLREAKDAHIIVGNHALMFSWPKSFPRPPYVVVDEAHKIENESTRAFTYEVTGSDLESMQKQLQNLQGLGSLFYLLNNKSEGEDPTEMIAELRTLSIETATTLNDHIFELPNKLEIIFKKMPRYTDLYWNELPMISSSEQEPLRLGVFHHLESVFYVLKNVYDKVYPHMIRWQATDMNGESEVTAWTRFEAFTGSLEDLLTGLTYLLKIEKPSVPYSLSMKFHQDQGFAFCASPVNTGKILHDQLLQGAASVVFTSATLANAKGDTGTKGMEWATGYLYTEPERRFKAGMYLPSVYDYANKTKVFLCDDTPSIYESRFVPDVLENLSSFIEDIGGRTLLLFSAKARFEKAVEYLLQKFDGKLPVYVQGMGSNVVEEFKNSGNGILVGMESFGEGIDVPGDSLSFVFIDKIPDLSMEQVVRLRREFYETNIGNEFEDYYLAHRCRSLHQKLGRLLRTENDSGAVVIVDSRIKKWKNSTMSKLVKHMEPYRLLRTTLKGALEESKAFIEDQN
ncbi:helicase C-terminal domain-containing protein [Bacteriovorax sp. DB6_IX]|uniref:helicase C-terminal domain-containing protein n=1 Tax=Bacteriovorax sp. DB6_IX TaxID=1353530 RepID=UPI000389DC86|nr:helicase C-terminal domain-containing protein [Bacteriovorax sp. DB6_IX]EQC52827.1 exonuclease [Bacteriovorax sp. DB6_IX]